MQKREENTNIFFCSHKQVTNMDHIKNLLFQFATLFHGRGKISFNVCCWYYYGRTF